MSLALTDLTKLALKTNGTRRDDYYQRNSSGVWEPKCTWRQGNSNKKVRVYPKVAKKEALRPKSWCFENNVDDAGVPKIFV